MNKGVLLASISLLISFLALFIISVPNLPQNAQITSSVNQNTDTASQSDIEPIYIAKISNGYISIYESNSDKPYLTTDIDIRTLRNSDIKILSTGFPIYSKTELSSFLEDFGT